MASSSACQDVYVIAGDKNVIARPEGTNQSHILKVAFFGGGVNNV